ncbi:MAG: TonB-dependent receptor [Burkholderiaceae bacterium]|nr:TonB-dependent receptor [Burkholderiaceae bacterium]
MPAPRLPLPARRTGVPRQPRAALRALRALLLAGVAGTAAAAPAAQDAAPADELEQLLGTPVYAAAKYSQDVADAPAAVTVLTQGDIRAFGWRTLGELLGAVRGVFLRYDRAYTYAGVRGLSRPGDYSSRLLLLIDGQRANENIYDSVLVGHEFPLDLALVERVEFIPGAGSVLYGPNAVFGVINVVTRSAASLRGSRVGLTLDDDGTRRLQFSQASELASGSLLLSASAGRRRGSDLFYPEYAAPGVGDGMARGLDGERDRKVYARWSAADWSLAALASERRKQIPTAAYGLQFGDRAAEWTDRLGLLGLHWQRLDGQGLGWSLQAGLGDYHYQDLGRYEDGSLMAYRNQGRWWQADLRRSLRLGQASRLTLGLDLQRNLRQDTRTLQYEPTPRQDAHIGTQGQRAGLYLDSDLLLADGLRADLGLRLDRQTDGRHHLSPRLALLWRPDPDTVLKALYGRAWREPNVYERLPASSVDRFDDSLRREQSSSVELTGDWQVMPRLRLSGSLYRNRTRGLIEQIEHADSGELVYRNVGDARVRGLEAETEWLDAAGWRLRASWSRQRVQVDGTGPVANAPRSLTRLHAQLPLAPALRLGLELQRTGQRRTLAGAALNAVTLAHATLNYEPAGQPWSVGGSVYNLTDRRHADPAGPEHRQDVITQDGRRLALRWTLSF